MSVCDDCLRELFDPADRRYRYPFINCTNCGPRFTIITDMPYDRPLTTMRDFPLCPDCAQEYQNPLDRRFHAQPVACPRCGPQIWFESSGQQIGAALDELPQAMEVSSGDSGLLIAQKWLAEGKILAIKGLGGFHLACDANNRRAVAALRERKLRVDKPFAIMMADMDTVLANCLVDSREQELLESRQRPIVILRRKPDAPIALEVAPGQDTLGVMLPYTPLHFLLLSSHPGQPSLPTVRSLVMTSGNLAEEPIAYTNPAARQQLASLADGFLMHNRPIRVRCDDSVMRVAPEPGNHPVQPDRAGESKILPIRRSRGYAPYPVKLAWDLPPVLAAGAELKNAFCITRERYAFMSQHIGDMENFETLQAFEDSVNHFERLFRVTPELLAYDLHPDYLASRYILNRSQSAGLPAVAIQHHHAHIVACMAENGLLASDTVIGVAFDGTGYGDDGLIWGGEFLLSSYSSYQRMAHLRYVPLPGGDLAIREPWRIALAYLDQLGLEWAPDLPAVAFGERALSEIPGGLAVLSNQIAKGVNAPQTSSMGRLFDAVASLVGLRQTVNYEGQAAIELEASIDTQAAFEPYSFNLVPAVGGIGPLMIDPAPLFSQILADLRSGLPIGTIAARFHTGTAQMVLEVCRWVRQTSGSDQVALSGGVWQNTALLAHTLQLLEADGFQVFTHHWVPPNDGGLALGQALAAIHANQYQAGS